MDAFRSVQIATPVQTCCCMYSVMCHLAGVPAADPSAAAAGLPVLDSLNVWELVIGENKTSPRTRIHISPFTLIEGRFKLLAGQPTFLGGPTDFNGWAGPTYPNASSGVDGKGNGRSWGEQDCRSGCLYDIIADPTEHHEISAEHPEVLQRLLAVLAAENASIYDPGPPIPDDPRCCSQAAANGGFVGPWLRTDDDAALLGVGVSR